MNKIVILSVILTITSFASNAQALSYDDSLFSHTDRLSLETGYSRSANNTFLLQSQAGTSTFLGLSSSNAMPSPLTISKKTDRNNSASPGLYFAGSNLTKPLFASYLPYGLNAFPITWNKLNYLNSEITNSDISVDLIMGNVSISLENARSYGNFFPESLSTSLICAGLVCLPFIRRLKIVMRKEA